VSVAEVRRFALDTNYSGILQKKRIIDCLVGEIGSSTILVAAQAALGFVHS
jgi:hypothetical protein